MATDFNKTTHPCLPDIKKFFKKNKILFMISVTINPVKGRKLNKNFLPDKETIVKMIKKNYQGNEYKKQKKLILLYERLKKKVTIYRLKTEKFKTQQQLFKLYEQQYHQGELLPSVFLQKKISFQDAQIAIKTIALDLYMVREQLISECSDHGTTFWEYLNNYFLKFSVRKIAQITLFLLIISYRKNLSTFAFGEQKNFLHLLSSELEIIKQAKEEDNEKGKP